MTSRNRVLLASLVLLAAVCARADEWSKDFPISGKASLRVDAFDAELDVRATDAKQVSVRVVTHGYKIGANDLRIVDHQAGDQVTIELHRFSHSCFGFCNNSVRVEIAVPRQADLNLHTGDGNIKVGEVTGEFRLDSGDGSIELSGAAGRLNADTRDGAIRARGRFDLLDLHTGDGNIDVEAENGSRMGSSWLLRTGDGRIDLRVPSDLAADLDAHTGDGRINLDLPITVDGGVRENSVRGKLNGGGPSLELRSGDGSIRLGKL